MRKTLAVGRKEFRQIARDRRSLMVLLFVPAFFLLLYGYALNFDVSNIQLAVQDNDRTPASRELVNRVRQVGIFPAGRHGVEQPRVRRAHRSTARCAPCS